MAATVSKPTPFKPSETASAPEGAQDFVVIEVTLLNGSDKPVESVLLSTRATSGDAEAEQVFDFDQGIGPPSSKVLPGKTLKWREAYAKPGDDFVLTVDWNFGGGSGIYQ